MYVFSKENEQNGKLPLKQLSVLLYTSAESRRRCVLHIFQGIRPRIVQLCFSPVHALHHDVHRRSRLLHRPEADDIVRRRLSEEHLITEIHNGDPIRRLKFVFSFSEMQSIFFGDTQKIKHFLRGTPGDLGAERVSPNIAQAVRCDQCARRNQSLCEVHIKGQAVLVLQCSQFVQRKVCHKLHLIFGHREIGTRIALLPRTEFSKGHALSGNEYDQLLAAFTDAKSSRDQIQMLWENQRNELRQEFVQSCIEGDVVYDEKHLHQVLERLDAGFSGDWFGVVLLDAGGGAETLLDSGSEREALEDLLNHMAQGVRAYLLPRGRQWSILLNAATGSGIEQTVAELDALLKRAAREAGGDFLCAFSKPWRDFKNIHLAYLAANEALREQHEKAAGCQEQCGPTLQPAQVPRLSSEQEELLMRYIAAGNEEEAASVLQMILRHNWEEQELPVSMCRCLAYDLLCGILRCLGTMPEVWEQQREALRADLHLLRHAGTRDEIAQMLMATVLRSSAACEGFHTVAGAAREQPMERIMQCVNEHYRDLDFNVSRAAEYLGMSVPYLSNLFKQQTGIGLLNYISGLRVKYAKQCILERHISVAQAAHEAGFENINTFIRIFKKYEGTTPGSINS